MSLIPFSKKSSPRGTGGASGGTNTSPAGGGSSGPQGGGGGDKKAKTSRRYTINLSFSALVTSIIVLIVAAGWIFSLGVIVGRGYNPETKLPELAKLLPPTTPTPEEQTSPILKSEELRFMTELKQRPGTTSPVVPPGNVDPKKASTATTAQPTPPVTATPSETENKQRFDFIFQIAAFKNQDQAEKLRARLEGDGVRTRLSIEKGAKNRPKWYRVQALLRGTDADAVKLKQLLADAGIKDAQQLSKKPRTR